MKNVYREVIQNREGVTIVKYGKVTVKVKSMNEPSEQAIKNFNKWINTTAKETAITSIRAS